MDSGFRAGLAGSGCRYRYRYYGSANHWPPRAFRRACLRGSRLEPSTELCSSDTRSHTTVVLPLPLAVAGDSFSSGCTASGRGRARVGPSPRACLPVSQSSLGASGGPTWLSPSQGPAHHRPGHGAGCGGAGPGPVPNRSRRSESGSDSATGTATGSGAGTASLRRRSGCYTSASGLGPAPPGLSTLQRPRAR